MRIVSYHSLGFILIVTPQIPAPQWGGTWNRGKFSCLLQRLLLTLWSTFLFPSSLPSDLAYCGITLK